jgi:hypothetical protein
MWHRSLLAATSAATICLGANAGPIADGVSELQTVGGTLKAHEGVPSYITLNGKKLAKIEFLDHLQFTGKYSIAGKDVVMVQEQCGGSACGSFMALYLLTVEPNGKMALSSSMDTDGDGFNKVVEAPPNALRIETRTVDGRRTKTLRWTYTNGKVTAAK